MWVGKQDAKQNSSIKEVANVTTQTIAEVDPKWGARIQWWRFATHNFDRLLMLQVHITYMMDVITLILTV
jgi:hypothetical protein